MTTLDIINHLRLVSLADFHAGLKKLAKAQPGHFNIVTDWLMSLKPTIEPPTPTNTPT